jgi:hypothetical protein
LGRCCNGILAGQMAFGCCAPATVANNLQVA